MVSRFSAAIQHVVAAETAQGVVALTSVQEVLGLAAGELVVAVEAVHGRAVFAADPVVVAVGGVDDVLARIEDLVVERGDVGRVAGLVPICEDHASIVERGDAHSEQALVARLVDVDPRADRIAVAIETLQQAMSRSGDPSLSVPSRTVHAMMKPPSFSAVIFGRKPPAEPAISFGAASSAMPGEIAPVGDAARLAASRTIFPVEPPISETTSGKACVGARSADDHLSGQVGSPGV